MKIEKIHVKEEFKPTDEDHPISHLLYEVVAKINTIIDALICPNCGHVKGLTGLGLCFDCDQAVKSKK